MKVNDPIIISGVTLMLLGVIIPCFFWFIRNLFRIILKKDFWWFNKLLLSLSILGICLFIIGLILLIVKVLA